MTRDELMTIGKRHGVKITHMTKTADLIFLAFRLGRMEENTACQIVLKECGQGNAVQTIQRDSGHL